KIVRETDMGSEQEWGEKEEDFSNTVTVAHSKKIAVSREFGNARRDRMALSPHRKKMDSVSRC
ncbi:MAG: hypothetical protein KC931_06985, partial [Candidatus Omnitrophica bacterium]|nr:hypothetical protein [Candidatus Omnitrophota bacterium]